MATFTCSPEVIARKNGACPECPDPIVKDESWICRVDGCKKGWMHVECAKTYIAHRELFDELNHDDLSAEGAGEES